MLVETNQTLFKAFNLGAFFSLFLRLSIPKKAIHNLTCMETIEKESEYSERTLKNQQFDTRLIEHMFGWRSKVSHAGSW
jgi:hypothetical protein